ncbi:MAG: TIGR03790 family protein [Methylotenera sp.]|nr:TIGR03790 family protein [Methylotenera sp.]
MQFSQYAKWLQLALICGLGLYSYLAQADNNFLPHPYGVTSNNIAVVVNTSDPKSVEVSEYYMQARKIPPEHLIKVSFPPGAKNMKPDAFRTMRNEVIASLTPDIQAIVLVWTTPYMVSCNSITSAMTLGYDAKQCEKTCAVGTQSPYFDSSSTKPYDDYGLRLSMLLPVESVEKAKNLIDKGVFSSFKINEASAYLLSTSDKSRNTRSQFFPRSGRIASKQLNIKTLQADTISDKQDVMFYFTGLSHVPYLNTLSFMPGAVGDHLTSSGGDLLGSTQMSSLRWLDAGATASYGSVSEPCNYWQKFPNPTVMMKHYLAGETVIEAYWKSIAWPARGLLIGEPLAAPYCQSC